MTDRTTYIILALVFVFVFLPLAAWFIAGMYKDEKEIKKQWK